MSVYRWRGVGCCTRRIRTFGINPLGFGRWDNLGVAMFWPNFRNFVSRFVITLRDWGGDDDACKSED